MAGVDVLESLAREGRLYASVILYGASIGERRAAAVRLGRTLLCETPATHRDDCRCRHCSRIEWPNDGGAFHPDFRVLERDLRTATSTEGVRGLLRTAQLSPFEARGQVFVVGEAETLSAEAANALLKMLEEPPQSAPRHFLLLVPSPDLLLATLRSRSLAFYLGSRETADPEAASALGRSFAEQLQAWVESGSAAHLLAAAGILHDASKWDDPRAAEPWALAASALVAAHLEGLLPPSLARAVLELAADVLHEGPEIRRRSVPALRVLEGLVARRLAAATMVTG